MEEERGRVRCTRVRHAPGLPCERFQTNRLSGINSTERFEKPSAQIVVSDDLHETQDIFVSQSYLFEHLNISWAACIGGSCHFDGEFSDLPFAGTQVGLGKTISDLLRQFLIFGHSTEGCQMACRSVHAAVIGRDKQSRNLLFTERQASGFVIDGPLKIIERRRHLRC